MLIIFTVPISFFWCNLCFCFLIISVFCTLPLSTCTKKYAYVCLCACDTNFLVWCNLCLLLIANLSFLYSPWYIYMFGVCEYCVCVLFFDYKIVKSISLFWSNLCLILIYSGHGSFSNNLKLNSVVGHLLHSSILVPYHGWYVFKFKFFGCFLRCNCRFIRQSAFFLLD